MKKREEEEEESQSIVEEWVLESGWPPPPRAERQPIFFSLLPSFSLFRSATATSRKCTSFFFRRRAPQECHPEWENGVESRSEG